MISSEHPVRDLIAELASLQCFYSAKKEARRTFCRAHYFALPVDMRDALYRRIGEGYEAAYSEARGFLWRSA